jgi:predicted porin
VAAGYLHIDNGNATFSSRGTSTADSIFFSPVNAAYASARSIDIVRTGASYAIGPVTVGADYSFSQYLADAHSTFTNSEQYNNAAVFAFWSLTPAAHLELGYDYLKSHGSSSATYHQVALAGNYLLSKRTDLYAIAAYGHASGNNGAGSARAVISDGYAAAGSGSQQVAIVGIRHKF